MSGFTVFLKVTGGDKLSLEVTPKQTIAELKTVVATKCDIPAENQRLIYKGQVLKDEKTVEDYALAAEHVLHLVRGRSPGASSATASANASSQSANAPATSAPSQPGLGGAAGMAPMGGLGGMGNMGGMGMGNMGGMAGMMNNPEMMAQMMQSPIMQNMLNDPEMLRNMLQATPGMSEVLERNPEFNQMLNNPEVLRESMRLAANPALMREHMRNTDRAVSNIESHPEGFNALRRMYENVQEPLMNAAQETTPTANQANPFASLFGGMGMGAPASGAATSAAPPSTSAASAAPNTAPLPNPWAPTSASGAPAAGGMPLGGALGSMGGQFGMPNPADLASNMQNPMWQAAMQQMLNNPEMMRSSVDAAAAANPQIRQMLDRDPAMREQLMNPETIRRAMDPANMQAMLQMQQAMQQLQSSGMMPAGAMPGFGGPMGGGAENPQDINGIMERLGFGAGGGGFGGPAALGGGLPPVADPETAYATQLEQLTGMGFYDRQANIMALQATGGNVNAAVDRLLQGP
ncbi:g10690 [Coccomyxa viridis]|uniref:G10690 protein n=1 Tax=Coccomyxa viridis TaxID=1274662 RepID=A0ABP1G6E4_9CHLO